MHPETDFAKDKESRASQYLLLARADVGNQNVLQFAKRAIEISGTGKVAEETRTWMEVRGLVDATPEAIAAFSEASVHAEKRNQPEVERQMRECIKTHPSFIHSYYGLATALNQLGRTAEAEEILRTAQKMNPRYTRTYLGFSQCEYKKKNYAKALEYAKKALELDPLDYYNQRQVIELTTEGAAAKLPQ